MPYTAIASPSGCGLDSTASASDGTVFLSGISRLNVLELYLLDVRDASTE